MRTPHGDESYNPLDEENLARSVADALEREPAEVMPPAPFTGPGLYAIYFIGSSGLYAPLGELARRDTDLGSEVGPHAVPIYVGRAFAGATRRAKKKKDSNDALLKRINDHAKSINAAETLNIKDFRVRHLRVKDIWIPLGEYGLLHRYTPIWNQVLDGFGNHDPGSGRANQARSSWDTLHPGRSWAYKLPENPEPASEFEARVKAAIDAIVSDRPVPREVLAADGKEELPGLDL